MSKTYTKGDVIVEDIKLGDIQYEFDYGLGIKSEVIELPTFMPDITPEAEGDGMWTWKNKCVHTGEIITYGVRPKYSHYGPRVYTTEAYWGCRYADGSLSGKDMKIVKS